MIDLAATFGLTVKQFQGILISLAVLGICAVLIYYIHRKPFDLAEAEKTTREVRQQSKGPWNILHSIPDVVYFIEFLPHYPIVAITALIWAPALTFFGFQSIAFAASFFLFCFGLISSNALEQNGRKAKLHYLGLICSFTTLMIICTSCLIKNVTEGGEKKDTMLHN